MRALVLSGGSTRGALQVGALRALVERGFEFDLIIGVSIGSLNGVFFAHNPGMETVKKLENIWLSVKKKDIFPEGRVKALIRVISNKKSLFSNDALYKFVLKNTPVMTFAELKVRTLIPAVDIKTKDVYVFGKDPYDSVPDALMASSALPPYFPPWKYKGIMLIDGGFYSNLPYDIAINEGAKEIVALHITGGRSFDDEIYNIYGILAKSVGILLEARLKEQVEIAKKKRAKVLYIPLEPPVDVSIFDFTKTKLLIEMGYEQAVKALEEREKDGFANRMKGLFKKITDLKGVLTSKKS